MKNRGFGECETHMPYLRLERRETESNVETNSNKWMTQEKERSFLEFQKQIGTTADKKFWEVITIHFLKGSST